MLLTISYSTFLFCSISPSRRIFISSSSHTYLKAFVYFLIALVNILEFGIWTIIPVDCSPFSLFFTSRISKLRVFILTTSPIMPPFTSLTSILSSILKGFFRVIYIPAQKLRIMSLTAKVVAALTKLTRVMRLGIFFSQIIRRAIIRIINFVILVFLLNK